MREVIEAIDGPIYINLCMISGASCDRKSYCPAHPFWSKAQEAMLSVLESAIVADLAAESSAPPSRIPPVFPQFGVQNAGCQANSPVRSKSEAT